MSSIALVLFLSNAIVALVAIPLWLGLVPPNRLYGFRTPRTGNDPEVWYPINKLSAFDLILGGTVGAVAVFLTDLFSAHALASAPWLLLASMVPLLLAVAHSFWAASAWLAAHDAGEGPQVEERSERERAQRASTRESER